MIPKDYKVEPGETGKTGGKRRKARKRMRKAIKGMVGRKTTLPISRPGGGGGKGP